ncbi:MAG: hypothetical protein EA356_08425 [Geminicoccaceae bacterium]|nr:MAG: hypothetical protein EA356_08425 [Geminicoccaceae bacterium]
MKRARKGKEREGKARQGKQRGLLAPFGTPKPQRWATGQALSPIAVATFQLPAATPLAGGPRGPKAP